MKVRKLKKYLNNMIGNGHGDEYLYFIDNDGDWQTIESVYIDDDGDVVLDSEGDDDWYITPDALLYELEGHCENDDVYVVDSDGDYYGIEGGWYFDDEDDLCMDVYYL